MLGHDSVGDEDLLLGILRADEGIGASALSSLGVTLEEAREASEGMLSDALASIGVSLEEVRQEAGDASRCAYTPVAGSRCLPGARRRWLGLVKRCEGWETTTSAPSTSC
jgi:hypothetical protein